MVHTVSNLYILITEIMLTGSYGVVVITLDFDERYSSNGGSNPPRTFVFWFCFFYPLVSLISLDSTLVV